MGIQTITTPAGDEMVVLPRTEYDALLLAAEQAFEDGAEAAAYDAAIASLDPNDILPASVTAMILAGKGRLAAYRDWRALAQADLANRSGLSAATLAQLEAGERLLTKSDAVQLAAALEVPVGWLTE